MKKLRNLILAILLLPSLAFGTPTTDLFTLLHQSTTYNVGIQDTLFYTQALRLLDDIANGVGGGGGGTSNITGINGVAPSVGAGTTDTGTLRVTLSTDSTGQVKLAAGVAAIGSVSVSNFPGTQPVSGTVTANAGTNLNTSALALDATAAKLNVAQAAALGTNTGPLVQGSVTTAAPTYTTGQVNPLSLTTAGGLRVDNSGNTQPVSGTVTANAGTNLNTSALALESGGNLASTKTNTDNLNLAIASTTSGQKGNLNFGAVTTAAPSYTTAQSNPFSLTTAGGLRTDLATIAGTTAVNGSGTLTGALRVNLPTNGDGAIANITTSVTPGGSAGNLGKVEDGGFTDGETGVLALGQRTDTPVSGGNVSATGDHIPFITDSFGRTWVAAVQTPVIDQGLTQHKLVSAATTNATSVKASQANLYNIEVFNNGAAARYLKLYNKASAPTVGTDVPVKVLMVPAGGGLVLNSVNGIQFATGLAYSLNAGLADADTGAVAVTEVVVNLDYK